MSDFDAFINSTPKQREEMSDSEAFSAGVMSNTGPQGNWTQQGASGAAFAPFPLGNHHFACREARDRYQEN